MAWFWIKVKSWLIDISLQILVISSIRYFDRIIVNPQIKKGLNTSNFEQVSESLKDEVSNIAQSENVQKIGEILYTVDTSGSWTAFGLAFAVTIIMCEVYECFYR